MAEDRRMSLRFANGVAQIIDEEDQRIVGSLLPELVDPEDDDKIINVEKAVAAQDGVAIQRWLELAWKELGKNVPDGKKPW